MKPEDIIIAPVITEKSNDELQAGKYHVEFEYGGIKYQSVASNLSKINNWK